MSDPSMPSLPPEVEALLAEERPIPPVPPALHAATWERLGPVTQTAAVSGSAPVASSGLVAKLVVGVLSFSLGGAVVALLDRTVLAEARPAPQIVIVPAAPAVEAPVLEPTEPLAGKPVERAAVTPRPSRPAPKVEERSSAPATTLAEERAIIEVARTALARGQTADVLSAVAEHERRFERGQLAEERDFIRLQALVAEGNTSEASRQRQRFRERYPTSVFLPAIDEFGPHE